MDSVLIVSNTSATLLMLSDTLGAGNVSRIVAAQTGAAARRNLIDDDFDLIIIDTPLPDEFGDGLSLYASEISAAGIILIVKADAIADFDVSLEDSGVFVLPKPVSPSFFYQAVKLLSASRARLLKLQAENDRLRRKIEEIRIVDRAKCLLVQRFSMTEAQAHRFIEKQAMDTRQSRTDTAISILKTHGA